LVKSQILGSFKGGHNVGDQGKDDKFVVANKLRGDVLKTGDNQGKVHGKIRSEEGGNNEVVGNGVDDKDKKSGNLKYLYQIYAQGTP